MDLRKLFDKDLIYSYDLEGKDVTVTIERVKGGELTGMDGKKTKKPILYFKGTRKGFGLNITNLRIIAGIYGSFKSEDLIGKKITLFPTTCDSFGKVAECIRVRPKKPGTDAKEQTIKDDVPQPEEVGTEHDDVPEATA